MRIAGHFTTSVVKALKEIDPNFMDYPGLIMCGSHAPEKLDVDFWIDEIRKARESGIPFLGICFGHQLAAIEYARNVLGNPRATSEEFGFVGVSPDLIVYKLPQLKVGLHTAVTTLPGRGQESFWNNFAVRSEFLPLWQKADNFITVQYHPEYQSSKDNPHPLLKHFLNLCKSE